MKISALMFGLVLTPLLPLAAQVTVEVALDQEQFLSGEALPAAVRVTNRSGQTLHLGSDPDWLTFSVESRAGAIVLKGDEVPVLGEFTVESSQVATRQVDLAPYFTLNRAGRYRIIATVRIKEWEQQVNSKPKTFDIIHGAHLWSQEFGLPTPAGVTNQSPEVRKYTLEQANYLRSQLRLYFRLTDASGEKVIKVFAIGPMVGFGNPEVQIDKLSNLHVLYQTGARAFNYTVINPDGDLLVRETHDYTETRPKLKVDEEGRITVAGGQRRPTSTDLPKTSVDDAKSKKP